MTGQFIAQLVLWLIAAVIVIFILYWVMHWLYRRSTKEISFVRTGFLGEKVVINGGAFVWPIVHDITPVSMNSLELSVTRSKDDALITKDRMRLDVEAEFYVRVAQTEKGVSLAAATMGRRTLEPERIHALLSGKFISALRTIASEMTAEEIYENRNDYMARVMATAQEGLDKNGLELESIAITNIDQTDIAYFNPSNRFDAEGLTAVIQAVEERRKLRNDIEQDAMIKIRTRNLEAEKQALDIERESEEARLEQEREIEFRRAQQRADLVRERAEREKEAERASLSNREEVETAKIAQEKQISEARISSERSVEISKIEATEATSKTRIEQEERVRALEIARNKAIDEATIASREAVEEMRIAQEARLSVKRAESEEEVNAARIAEERKTKASEIDKDAELRAREIEKNEAIESAEISSKRLVEQMRIEKEQLTSTEELARDEAIAAAIAGAEAVKAKAAEAAERTKTVEATEAAKRQKSVDVVMAEKLAEEKRIAAEAEQVRAAVEAEAQRLINEAENVLTDEARHSLFKRKMLEHVEGIVSASVKPLEKINDIKIMQLGGGNVQSLNGDGIVGGSPTDEVINSALRYRVQAPMIDSLLSDIGIEGSNIAKSDIIRTANDMTRTASEMKKLKADDKPSGDKSTGEKK